MPSLLGVQTCALDRKSTRLNSSHSQISYAVFCLKKNTMAYVCSGDNRVFSRYTVAYPLFSSSLRVPPLVVPPSSGGLLPLPARAAPRSFNDTATTEISTLSLHDALPI